MFVYGKLFPSFLVAKPAQSLLRDMHFCLDFPLYQIVRKSVIYFMLCWYFCLFFIPRSMWTWPLNNPDIVFSTLSVNLLHPTLFPCQKDRFCKSSIECAPRSSLVAIARNLANNTARHR